jgi:hypothetical protein
MQMAGKMTDAPRRLWIGEIIAMSLTSVAAVTGGNEWLLLGTLPLLVVNIWMLVLKSIRANSPSTDG